MNTFLVGISDKKTVENLHVGIRSCQGAPGEECVFNSVWVKRVRLSMGPVLPLQKISPYLGIDGMLKHARVDNEAEPRRSE